MGDRLTEPCVINQQMVVYPQANPVVDIRRERVGSRVEIKVPLPSPRKFVHRYVGRRGASPNMVDVRLMGDELRVSCQIGIVKIGGTKLTNR